MQKRNIIILVLLVASFGYIPAKAVPAYPYSIQSKIPDGSLLTIQQKGDEYFNWIVSEDGYILLRNNEGFLEYAVQNENGDLVCSGIKAHNVSQRSAEEIALLNTISKGQFFSDTQRSFGKQLRMARGNAIKAKKFNAEGEIHVLMILAEFQDVRFYFSKEAFDALVNQENYHGYDSIAYTGSVRDYFRDNSFGKMDMITDVVGPVRVSRTKAYYGAPGVKEVDKDSAAETFIAEAVELAYASTGVDFSKYDNDKDGVMDGLYVIYAGSDQSQTAIPTDLWAHENPSMSNPLNINGITINTYSCSGELAGFDYQHRLCGLGVIVHEFSHTLGLMDYYDTDYNANGYSNNPDIWDVMASGSHNNEGRTPPYHSAFSREQLGWQQMKEITGPAQITLPKTNLTDSNSKVSYKLYTYTGGVDKSRYFTFENRSKVKWDNALPDSGMLVYYIDENVMRESHNRWNAFPERQGITVVPASNKYNYPRYATAVGGGGILFPFGTNYELSNTSKPSLYSVKNYSSNTPPDSTFKDYYPSYYKLTQITRHPDASVSFNIEEDDDVQLPDICGQEVNNGLIQSFDQVTSGTPANIDDWHVFDLNQSGINWVGKIANNENFVEASAASLPNGRMFETWLVSPLMNGEYTEISFKNKKMLKNDNYEVGVRILQCNSTNQQTYVKIDIPLKNFPALSQNVWTTSLLRLDTLVDGNYAIAFMYKGKKESTSMSIQIDSVVFARTSVPNIQGEDLQSKIVVSPNPVKDDFFIKGQNVSTVELFDITGRLILQKNIFVEEERINIADLSTGLYTLRITLSGNTVVNKKIIKK